MLADLPTLQEYQALARDRLLLAKFEIYMHDLFGDYESLQQKATDALIDSKLGTLTQ